MDRIRIVVALSILLAASGLQRSRGIFASGQSAADTSLSSALCPVVYPDDQTSGERGYHYTFFGNAFFINDQGYLLTAAHVLETFRDGGQAYIIVNRKNAPPSILKVAIIAVDAAHDVAILKATPNPFESRLKVTALPLSSEAAVAGDSVLAISLHPGRLQDAHSFESPHEDLAAGQVLSFESTQPEKSAGPAEIFLLSHPVVLGQSGSAVIATKSRAVVGIVEGRWLRAGSASLAVQKAFATSQRNAVPGAAVPIRYGIELLNRNGIPFESSPAASLASAPAK